MIHDAPPLSRRRFAGALGAALGAVVVPRSVCAAANPAPTAAPAVIDLSSNENPYGPSPAALEAMTRSQAVAGRYPDAAEQAATEAIARGFQIGPTPPVVTQVKADRDCASVAAASVIAKVHRDRIMRELDAVFPGYGWAGNKGYGSTEHFAAIAELGASDIHRRTWLHPKAG